MATIFDVATRAGVGVGTVSRVLNDSPLVADATRRRVLEVIAELGYRPSSLARGLSLGKTSTIGVVAPYFTTASVVERLRGIEAVIKDTEYRFMLLNVENSEQRNRAFRSIAAGDQTDGAIVVSLHPGITAHQWAQPVVFLDVRVAGAPSLFVDNVRGGWLATRYLLGLGHRRIGFVGDLEDSPHGFTSSSDRRRGFELALQEAEIEVPDEYIQRGAHGRDNAHRMTRVLLDLPDRPTAVFAASDVQALGVLEAVRRAGMQVPDDLSVIGFDDIEVAAYVGLTTVHQPLELSGRLAARRLLDLLAGSSMEVSEERLETEVKVRNSTAPPLERQTGVPSRHRLE